MSCSGWPIATEMRIKVVVMLGWGAMAESDHREPYVSLMSGWRKTANDCCLVAYKLLFWVPFRGTVTLQSGCVLPYPWAE